jgi:hypothetical protein
LSFAEPDISLEEREGDILLDPLLFCRFDVCCPIELQYPFSCVFGEYEHVAMLDLDLTHHDGIGWKKAGRLGGTFFVLTP